MSRSVKKQPVCSDQQKDGSSWAKKQANKAVRRYPGDIPKGNGIRNCITAGTFATTAFTKLNSRRFMNGKQTIGSR